MMNCADVPNVPPAAECFLYRPGDWRQDIYTIPLEALAVAAVSSVKPPETPRWPFANESANEERNPSRHPGTLAAGIALSVAAPLTATVLKDSPETPVFHYMRGLIHAHLWTEFVTSSAKNFFGRKRPFYDTAARQGQVGADDRRSFFSGHSAHSFTFATYATQFAFDGIRDPSVAWFFAALLNGSAAWVASSRAIDHQHNWSDVLTGTMVGSLFGYLTYQRVEEVSQVSINWSLSPDKISLIIPLK